MNRERAIRLAYFQALNGNLSYNSLNIPISDSKLESNSDVYVVLGNQTTVSEPVNYHEYFYASDITLTIYCLFNNSVSKDVMDNVAEQIENIVLTDTPKTNGLIQQTGWDISGVHLRQTSYQSDEFISDGYNNILTKTLNFSQTVNKTG